MCVAFVTIVGVIQISKSVISMGDGENDIAMFKEVRISIGIGRKEAKHFVETPKEGFEKIMEILKHQKNKIKK